jgi:hypothetical protein
MRAPDEKAACVAPAAVEEIHFPEEPAAAPIAEPVAPAAVGEIYFPETEANFRAPETYCPWNWTCPHLVNDLPAPKTLEIVNIQEPTTTAARPSVPAESENAYLARFLAPASRVGEFLQIDDAAAGAMWTASVAVQPALTPREFCICVRAKLAEWARVDDSRPGRRVRSLTGLLIRSMPNAVVGALYLQARAAAPAELARDCRQAREILAEPSSSPRDRAWAAAILAEADGHDTRRNVDEKTIAAIAARYLR